MQINARLLKILAVIGACSSAMLFGTLLPAMTTAFDAAPTPLIAILSAFAFASLLWLWVYWLVFFHRTREGESSGCATAIPIFDSSYKTVAFLRELSADAA
jgi:hypothetical protein